MRIASVLFLGYLFGSIPFGYLIVRATAGADVRETGSGGTGATNVTRRAGRWAGVLTLLLDAGKGAAAVLAVKLILVNGAYLPVWAMAAGILAVIGHCFPVWLGFRGGKGVATALGVLAVLGPWGLVVFAAIFLLFVWTTRYVSVGSIAGFVSLPIYFLVILPLPRPPAAALSLLVGSLLMSVIVIFMHRENLKRLRGGTESKFR